MISDLADSTEDSCCHLYTKDTYLAYIAHIVHSDLPIKATSLMPRDSHHRQVSLYLLNDDVICPCVGSQRDYSSIMKLARGAGATVKWNDTFKAPYFNQEIAGVMHQVINFTHTH